ncbi:hypothetical protein SAMD00019534_017760 [Acytostelium subglobosum LB1]|uniref:hypothetical protein n=1 Tax=Acytostelium subglobosum LB1 TaxID=1410327 RepID=UPI0006447E6E|nr:hypothetical protein SAMD00019534_017760 [Acytostelium subglobosum LB1]GAM18601.1 hypothetical protein SAMD00019534_017760 [Acytostelium subglobosum LB1]|eukprot:XP_012757821.1 hypothetical protein SAMD00019534_017760 [Acytostelium subglobosum LB1]
MESVKTTPVEIKEGLKFRLRSRKGHKNRDGDSDWYLAYYDKDGLVTNGSTNKHSEWIIKSVDKTNDIVYIKHCGAGSHYLGITEQLEATADGDPEFSAKLRLIWLDSGRVCIMSYTQRERKNRTGSAGPHIGVAPRGDLIGNAGRGDWGQFDLIPILPEGEVASATLSLTSLSISDPGSPAMRLLTDFPRHRQMFGGVFFIEQKPTKLVKAQLKVDIKLPHMKVDRWALVTAAPPSPLPIQDVKQASLKVYNGAGDQLVSGGDMLQTKNGHFMFRALAKGHQHHVQARYEIEAQLFAISLKQAGPKDHVPSVVPLSAEQRAYHLKHTTLMDFNNTNFVQWVNGNNLHPIPFVAEGVEPLLCFAYRVFLFLKIYFSYIYAQEVKSRKASDTIVARATDCGGFCILFAAIMRMHGIPARLLFGRWASTPAEGEQCFHVKGEFYADGIGWIPYDPASAILHDHATPHTKFFGNDGGNFITMHLDHNIDGIDTAIIGNKQLEFTQGVSYWVTGSGTNDKSSVVQKWTVQ